MRDLYNNLNAVYSIVPNVVNDDTDGTGTGVDLKGYEGALILFCYGDSGDSLSGSVKFQSTLQESDSASTGFTDVAAADMLGEGELTVIDAAAEDQVIQAVGYIGNKRYIRAFIDTTGTHTSGTPCCAVVIRGFPRHN